MQQLCDTYRSNEICINRWLFSLFTSYSSDTWVDLWTSFAVHRTQGVYYTLVYMFRKKKDYFHDHSTKTSQRWNYYKQYIYSENADYNFERAILHLLYLFKFSNTVFYSLVVILVRNPSCVARREALLVCLSVQHFGVIWKIWILL